MIEFLKRFFGQSGSSATAKERLRLVLMTDHLELAPELIEAMKRDLVDVISRHVEVDRDKIEVNFERQDSALAMLANIPDSFRQPTERHSPTLVPPESAQPACRRQRRAAAGPQAPQAHGEEGSRHKRCAGFRATPASAAAN